MLALISLLLCTSTTAFAGTPVRSAGNLGIGLGGGYWIDGLSLKYFMSQDNSLQIVLGTYGWGHDYHDYYYDYGNNGLGINADYLWEMPAIATGNSLELAWSAGLGPTLALGNDIFALGIHGTLGLELNFVPIPIDIVFEYKPGLMFVPGVYSDLGDFDAMIRIYPF